MRVLIVEDELKLSRLLRKGLQEDGHAVDLAETGEDALWMAGSTASRPASAFARTTSGRRS